MQPSRNQCANCTQNSNFVTKLGMSNPWYIYFPKMKQKVGKLTAGSLVVQPFLGYIQGKTIINYIGINFLKHIFALNILF